MKKAGKISFLLILTILALSSCKKPQPILLPPTTEQGGLQIDQSPVAASTSLFGITLPKKNKIKVGLLLPLSGKNKDLGQSLLNAATLSLFENDGSDSIELVVFDTKDTNAAATVKEAASRGIKIVIGPVFSNSIEAISDTVKNEKMIALSFSNNMDLSSKKGIFLMGFFPEQQIEKIVSYSISRKRNNFSIIAPNNQYGIKVANLFKETVRRKDGNFIASEFYLSGKDVGGAATRAVNAFTVPAKWENRKNKKDDKLRAEDKIYSNVILVPESGANLSRIVAEIKKANSSERDIKIIGTNQWDEVSTLNDENLIGGWFAAPDFRGYKDFEKRYYQTYKSFPVRISSIAYDAVGAIIKLANKSDNGQLTSDNFVNYDDKNGFNGVDGLFRFLPNGIVQRNLSVIEVGNAEFDVIESPSSFLKY